MDEQMRAVFTRNPPDVLIYVSFSNRVLCDYRRGLVLESMDHGRLTQTVHSRVDTNHGHGHLQWYRSTRNAVTAEFGLKDYEEHSLPAIDETFRRFNPDRLITVDGRRPAEELFETIKAKLTAMPLHRTVLPEIVRQDDDDDDDSVSGLAHAAYRLAGYGETGETDGGPAGYEGEEYETDGGHERRGDGNGRATTGNDGERTRLKSEFGRLCPVNFYYGQFKLGRDNYSARFAGKSYCFAGPDEMRLFERFPRQFLSVPRPGMPVRAIFYGPEALSGPAARAVGNFFGYNVIDANYVKRRHEENEKRAYASTIVNSVLSTVRQLTSATDENPSDGIGVLRNAVGDWIRLHYDRAYYGAAAIAEFQGEFQDENSWTLGKYYEPGV